MRRIVCLLACLAFWAVPAIAQPYPSKPVRIIVTNPPGGTVDILARTVGDELGKSLGAAFVVENRPGANGNLGAELLLKAPADGYVLMLTPPGPLAINAALYQSLPFDPKTAFAPVSLIAIAPLVLVVPPQSPARSLGELIALAKSKPGQLSYASQGNGSTGHLAMELLKTMVSIDVVHVPYKGSAPALADLLAANVQMMFDNTTSSLPHVKRGALRALAVAEPQRLRSVPDIPTVSESGVPGFEATPWFGMIARAGTPKDILDRLSGAIKAGLQRPEVESRFATLGVELRGSTPEEFARTIASETQKWERVIKASGAKAD